MNVSSRIKPRPAKWMIWALALVGAAAAAWAVWHWNRPIPEVPAPPNVASLEPQLRAYLTQTIAWVKEKPRDADRYATLGIVYAANGLWVEAGRCFHLVTKLKPREPLGHLYLGIAAQELGESDQALQQFRVVTERFPEFPQGYYRLGDALLRAGHADEAADAFQRLIELAPNEWRGFAGLGDAKLRLGELNEAVRLLERAVELDPNATVAHHLLGMAYRGLGRHEESKRELNLGMNPVTYPMPDPWSETAPSHMKLLQDQFDMASEYSQAGFPAKAIELLETARLYHPANVSLLNNLAVAYLYGGVPEQACELAQHVLQIDPRNISATMTLSAGRLALGQNEEALDHAETVIAAAPNQPRGYVARANALLALGRHREALSALKEAANRDPQNAELRLELGDLTWRNLNRVRDALTHYKAALDVNAAFWPAYIRIAELQLHSGQTNEARAALEKAREIAPNAPPIAALERRLN